MPRAASSPKGPGVVVKLTTGADARRFADGISRSLLGVSSGEAFARLERGELAGTPVEKDVRMLRTFVQREK